MSLVIPSILTSELSDFEAKARALEGSCERLEIDVMDGTLVPETSVRLEDVKGVRLPFELNIHLMVEDPAKYLSLCSELKAFSVAVHIESETNIGTLFSEMKSRGFERVLAVNPETEIDSVLPFADLIDGVLVMSVVPGAQGRRFAEGSLAKIREAKERFEGCLVGVDGGVREENILQTKEAGADYMVVGSAIWSSKEPRQALKILQAMVQ